MKKFWKWKNLTVGNQGESAGNSGENAVPERYHRRGKLV